MAIKVNGTEVISNLRKFTVTGTEGAYTDLQPALTMSLSDNSGNTTTGLNYPPYTDRGSQSELDGNVTWSLTGLATGRQMTMFVDASENGYDQDFSIVNGTVLYPNDTEPTWTDARYWLHRITCWSNDTASVISTSWGDAPIDLSNMNMTLTVGTQSFTLTALYGFNSGSGGGPYGGSSFGSLSAAGVPTGIYSTTTYGSGTIRSMTFRDGYLYQGSYQDDEFWLQLGNSSQFYPNQAPTTSGDGTGWSNLSWDTDSDSTNGAQPQSRASSTYSTFMSGGTYVTQWKRTYSSTAGGGNDSTRNPFDGASTVEMTFT